MNTIVSDTSARERIARIIDPDAWHETLRTDGCGEYWMGRRAKALAKADAILASLPSLSGEWVLVPTKAEREADLQRSMMAMAKAHDRVASEHEEGAVLALRCGNGMATTYWRAIALAARRASRKPPAMLSATPSFDGEKGK